VKAWIRTFGCRANQYDSEAVRAMIEASGGTVVGEASEADVAIFNSCAVTSEAEADLRASVRRTALPSIVMGCAAARDDGTIAALPGVRAVVAAADLEALAHSLDLSPLTSRLSPAVQSSSRALLRVQDGCDEHCTFCATTQARGANRSRTPDALVAESAALAATHPEIVITGIHIGTYGTDLGTTLGALMERLIGEVPELRFRLTSIEATEIDATLHRLFAASPRRLAPHVHAPLQSGSDRVLKRMGRHWYTAQTYRAAVERLAASVGPVFALSGDVITGFPGETEADHAATVAMVRALPFTALHVFPYSERPGTAAVKFTAPVRGDVARARAAELRAVAAEKASAYAATRVGGPADVVVIGDGPKRHGLTEDYLSVQLADPTIPRRTRFDATLALSGQSLEALRSP
jgi:threonylcarbamoyladenosine tRNA methylthiotransferase MtaB